MLPLTSTSMTMAMPSVSMRVCRSGQRGPARAKMSIAKAKQRRPPGPQRAKRALPAGSVVSARTIGCRSELRRRRSHHQKRGGTRVNSQRYSGVTKCGNIAMAGTCKVFFYDNKPSPSGQAKGEESADCNHCTEPQCGFLPGWGAVKRALESYTI